MSKKSKTLVFLIVFLCNLSFYSLSYSSEVDGTILSDPGYAFGENLGWINFGCDNCNVHITDTDITGHAWSKQYGWINFSPDTDGVTNNCNGELGGKAWSSSLGWIDFSGATINSVGDFTGVTEGVGTQAGRINFDCDNCELNTDWRQCAIREGSPAQIIINYVIGVIPNTHANITITNEGDAGYEYPYEWCIVTDAGNECGGGDDVYFASGAKFIDTGDEWNTILTSSVNTYGDYFFKVNVYFGIEVSGSSRAFSISNPSSGGGGGGGGGGGSSVSTNQSLTLNNQSFKSTDFNNDNIINSIDFSILLSFWKTSPPFKNISVDINKDNRVDSVDFSILLSYWGTNKI